MVTGIQTSVQVISNPDRVYPYVDDLCQPGVDIKVYQNDQNQQLNCGKENIGCQTSQNFLKLSLDAIKSSNICSTITDAIKFKPDDAYVDKPLDEWLETDKKFTINEILNDDTSSSSAQRTESSASRSGLSDSSLSNSVPLLDAPDKAETFHGHTDHKSPTALQNCINQDIVAITTTPKKSTLMSPTSSFLQKCTTPRSNQSNKSARLLKTPIKNLSPLVKPTSTSSKASNSSSRSADFMPGFHTARRAELRAMLDKQRDKDEPIKSDLKSLSPYSMNGYSCDKSPNTPGIETPYPTPTSSRSQTGLHLRRNDFGAIHEEPDILDGKMITNNNSRCSSEDYEIINHLADYNFDKKPHDTTTHSEDVSCDQSYENNHDHKFFNMPHTTEFLQAIPECHDSEDDEPDMQVMDDPTSANTPQLEEDEERTACHDNKPDTSSSKEMEQSDDLSPHKNYDASEKTCIKPAPANESYSDSSETVVNDSQLQTMQSRMDNGCYKTERITGRRMSKRLRSFRKKPRTFSKAGFSNLAPNEMLPCDLAVMNFAGIPSFTTGQVTPNLFIPPYLPFVGRNIAHDAAWTPSTTYYAKPNDYVSGINIPVTNEVQAIHLDTKNLNPEAASYIPSGTPKMSSPISKPTEKLNNELSCTVKSKNKPESLRVKRQQHIRVSSQLKPGNLTILNTQAGHIFKSYFCPESKRVNCSLAKMEVNRFATTQTIDWDQFARETFGSGAKGMLNRTLNASKNLVFLTRSGTCVHSTEYARAVVNVCVDYSGRKFALVEFD